MMIIKSILLIVSAILIVKGQEVTEYLNIIPYSDSKCKNNVGYGFSGLLYACFTIDSLNNWVFTSGGNEVTVTGYYNNVTEICNDNQSLYFPIVTYPVGVCIPSKDLPNFNFNIDGIDSNTPSFYKLTKTQTPTIPSNSYTTLFTYAQCSPDSFEENIVALQYFTNGTTVYYGTNNDETLQSFCNNGVPESITCIEGHCSQSSIDSVTCGIIGPFFNSSADGSNSDGSNSGSASASSSGFQININGDKNNRFSASSTGSGSISSDSQSTGSGSWQPSSQSSSETGYYQTIYCTPK